MTSPEVAQQRWIDRQGGHVVLIAILVAACGLRLWMARYLVDSFDSDEAVTGIMARNIQAGHQYTYFAGQGYNGSIEQYIQALFFWVTRMRITMFTLRLTQVVLSTGVVAMTYGAAKRIAGRNIGLLAAGLLAVGPFFDIYLGTRSYGAYDTTQLVCVGALWLVVALRAVGGSTHWRGRAMVMSGLLGLCCGVVFWLGWSGASVVLVVLVWFIPALWRHWWRLLAVVVGGIVGVIPVIVWSAGRGWKLPGTPPIPPATAGTIGSRFTMLYHTVAGEFFGLQGFSGKLQIGWLNHGAILVILIGFGVAWGAAWLVRRHDLPHFFSTTRQPHGIFLILLIIPVHLVFYVANSYAFYGTTPRYVFILYPFVAIALALMIRVGVRALRHVVPGLAMQRMRPAMRLVGVVAIGVVAGVAISSVHSVALSRERTIMAKGATAANVVAVMNWLHDNDVTSVYGEYWVATELDFFGEPFGVRAASLDFPEKNESALHAVSNARAFAYVGALQGAPSGTSTAIIAALKAHNVTYSRHDLPGGFFVVYNLNPQLRPAQLGLPS